MASFLNILLNFTFESEAIRANLHGKKRILGIRCIRKQGWRSGENTRLPPMRPGFISQTRPYMREEFERNVYLNCGC